MRKIPGVWGLAPINEKQLQTISITKLNVNIVFTTYAEPIQMNSLTVSCEVRYPHASRLDGSGLVLATSAGSIPFFSGQLVKPRRTAGLLRSLMNIVRSRFHIPAAMLARILAESDPVVTSSDERLRFEGFSACCGAYARIDLLPGSVEGEIFGRGTTNVDFNQPMLTELAKIRENDCVKLVVGTDQFHLSRNTESVIEKKVALPVRWIKGFVEVQQCQSRMTLVHEVNGREAMRFLRSLPRMKTNRREAYVVASGQGLRLSQIVSRNAVRVGGLERLRVLEGIVADSDSLRIYADEATGASAWELGFSDCRFCLVISPEVWRGFSGEGQILSALASERWEKLLDLVRSQLRWTPVIDEEALHRTIVNAADPNFMVDANSIRGALSALGTQGLVGFDLAEGSWFHRELPFDLNAVEKQHPRLKSARKLISENSVRVGKRSAALVEMLVQSGGVEHRVCLALDDAKCTCPWHAKHGTSRGPCKHILAAQIYLENQANGE